MLMLPTMETQTPAPQPMREADFTVVVRDTTYTFQPLNEKGRDWLERNVPREFHSADLVVVGSLHARLLLFWMALEGMSI